MSPRSITLAKCSARGASRRSSKHELTPTRSVANRPTHENLIEMAGRIDMHDPDLRIGVEAATPNTRRARAASIRPPAMPRSPPR